MYSVAKGQTSIINAVVGQDEGGRSVAGLLQPPPQSKKYSVKYIHRMFPYLHAPVARGVIGPRCLVIVGIFDLGTMIIPSTIVA